MSVRRAQAEIDSAEFAEWRAYLSRVEPHGAWRGDIHAGIVASTFANAHRGKNTKPFGPTDFMPDFDKPAKDRTIPIEDQVHAAMSALSGKFPKH